MCFLCCGLCCGILLPVSSVDNAQNDIQVPVLLSIYIYACASADRAIIYWSDIVCIQTDSTSFIKRKGWTPISYLCPHAVELPSFTDMKQRPVFGDLNMTISSRGEIVGAVKFGCSCCLERYRPIGHCFGSKCSWMISADVKRRNLSFSLTHFDLYWTTTSKSLFSDLQLKHGQRNSERNRRYDN